jgi:hypothetical protein
MSKGKYDLFFKDVFSVMRNKREISKIYNFYYEKRNEKHSYKLVLKEKNKNLKIFIYNGKSGSEMFKCLTMTFFTPSKIFTQFKYSKIHQINAGECGRGKKNRMLSGGYILNLANKLNDLFNVEYCKLNDDSRIVMKCDDNNESMSLKIIELIKYGKTWYEREGGFSLDDKNIYKLTKEVQELVLANILKYATNSMYKDILEFPVKQKDLTKLDKILTKLNVGRDIKMKPLYSSAFTKGSPLTLCEQKHLYDMTLQLPMRKMAKGREGLEHKGYKILNELSSHHYSFSESTRHRR